MLQIRHINVEKAHKIAGFLESQFNSDERFVPKWLRNNNLASHREKTKVRIFLQERCIVPSITTKTISIHQETVKRGKQFSAKTLTRPQNLLFSSFPR